MALLINQGKQDTSKDNKFAPIVEKNVLAQIVEIKLSEYQQNTLELTFRLLDGAHKGRFVYDRVNYESTSPFSWKYRNVRRFAGVPYNENEPATIDIEALLLNKAILLDLSIRKGTNKNGEEAEYQNITYKAMNSTKKVASISEEELDAALEDIYAATPAPKAADVSTMDTDMPNLTDDTEWD